MSPPYTGLVGAGLGFPRVSGDEPCLIIVGVDTTMFSLREWG